MGSPRGLTAEQVNLRGGGSSYSISLFLISWCGTSSLCEQEDTSSSSFTGCWRKDRFGCDPTWQRPRSHLLSEPSSSFQTCFSSTCFVSMDGGRLLCSDWLVDSVMVPSVLTALLNHLVTSEPFTWPSWQAVCRVSLLLTVMVFFSYPTTLNVMMSPFTGMFLSYFLLA